MLVKQRFSVSAIARRMKIDRHTVVGTLGKGRKRKLTERAIEDKERSGRRKTASEIAQEHFSETKVSIHEQTVRNILHQSKLCYKRSRKQKIFLKSPSTTGYSMLLKWLGMTGVGCYSRMI